MECGARYHPSRDQLALATEATASLDRVLPLSRLHAATDESDATWSALRELGLLGMTLPEQAGGSALGAAEEVLIVMALGRRLIAPSVLATIGVNCSPLHEWAPMLANSIVAAGYRRGDRIVLVHDRQARFLLVRGPTDAQLVAAPIASRVLVSALWLSELHEVLSLGEPIVTLPDQLLLRLRLLDAAILVGVAEAALDMAVGYAGIREQFGRPIGSFQAVKHHCANMVTAARRARDQATFAAIALDDHRDDAELQVECAFLTAGTAALRNAGLNIQIHGGIGFSDEADPHLLLKRAQLYINIAGGLEESAERVARIRPAT
jgi:alkylation response protein AidB-like acyl-CoA dehydrogenase